MKKPSNLPNGPLAGMPTSIPITRIEPTRLPCAAEPYAEYLRDGVRQILIENGILNADFTPNEATAAKLGWRLKDPGPETARSSHADR